MRLLPVGTWGNMPTAPSNRRLRVVHGLPAGVDLSFFVEQQLLQVCFGEYQVQLRFDDVTVSINDSEYTFRGARHTARDGQDLGDLLGKTCTSAARQGEGDLRLEIGGESVVVHDSNAPSHESYTINHDGV